MVFLVPYDGSPGADAALDRALEHAGPLDESVVAVSFIPTGSEYAERRKWIEPDADFALESARAELERKIAETTDDAERTFADSGASAPRDGVSERLRQVAADVDASVLFVGTDAEGAADSLQTPFGEIAPRAEYDVHLVRSY